MLREAKRNSFRVALFRLGFITQGFKANPGLELANTFGVDDASSYFGDFCIRRPRSKAGLMLEGELHKSVTAVDAELGADVGTMIFDGAYADR